MNNFKLTNLILNLKKKNFDEENRKRHLFIKLVDFSIFYYERLFSKETLNRWMRKQLFYVQI